MLGCTGLVTLRRGAETPITGLLWALLVLLSCRGGLGLSTWVALGGFCCLGPCRGMTTTRPCAAGVLCLLWSPLGHVCPWHSPS